MIANIGKYKFILLFFIAITATSKLVFYDDFDKLDFKKWKHDLTLAGGGNH